MNQPAKLAAAGVSTGLSLLFLIVYGSCNWIAAHRGDVGTWYYPWERLIPFVPVMIIPYMSIDLLFVAAPFICRSRDELRIFAARIVFGILVAGIFFLAMPLKMGVARPQVKGWEGALFQLLTAFDQPYNLFPSLHITLRTILADLYGRHTRGRMRFASDVWFSLIGFSTLLTYQHHVVDVIGGFVLAALCFYVFRERRRPAGFIPNLRVGGYYAAGSLLCLLVAFAAWPWTSLALWPAIALAITAAGYWRSGAAIYGKENGTLPLSASLILAPVRLGQYLSLIWYRRRCRAWDEVSPQLWIGAQLSKHEAEAARRAGVRAVLDLTAEFSEPEVFRNLNYLNIPVLDLTELSAQQLNDAAAFITREVQSGIVYVHCKVGYSRSAAALGAYLVKSGCVDNVEAALARLRYARPGIILRPEVFGALRKAWA